jgi:probable H4MPT-linked C1 transfer pathway protein
METAMGAGIVTGFDVGGAHLKAAQARPGGRVTKALQAPCRLWEGLDRLHAALDTALAGLAPVETAAVTMTGELADLFPDRAGGVRALLDAVAVRLPGADILVWAGHRGFVTASEARGCPLEVASANWLASAALAAAAVGEGLFVDIGSTTTDILLLADGEVRASGTTDRERLAAGELLYQGLTRTPLMAVTGQAPFEGRRVGLMNEHFATAADVWRVLGLLPEEADQHTTADNGPKTVEASARRLARMIGADLGEAPMAAWRRLAAWFAECQRRALRDAVELQLSRGLVADDAPVLGAGCGSFLVERLARDLGRPYRAFAGLVDASPEALPWIATCAPAVAVAVLAASRAERTS